MRIRTIKPEFFVHDRLADLSALHRLFFIGLWCAADREGRLLDQPRRLKVQILPYDSADADELLADLALAGFVTRYSAGGIAAIQINAFGRHQRPHQHEAASEIPAIPEGFVPSTTKAVPEHNQGSARAQPCRSLREGKGMDNGKGREHLAADAAVTALVVEPKSGRETWLTPYLDAWRDACGGDLSPGRAGKALARVRSEPDLADAWRNYLATTEPRFASVEAFAARWRAYHPDAVDTLHRGESLEANNRRAAIEGMRMFEADKARRAAKVSR